MGKIVVILCKVEEMAAEAKYMKGFQILAQMTTRNTWKLAPLEQLNQND